MNCPKCGHEFGEEDQFCGVCGTRRPTETGGIDGVKSKWVAGLLGIFLGWLGIHRFYLGYVYIGIAQIVVTLITGGIGGIWGFIEGILILTGNINKDAKGQPLKADTLAELLGSAGR